MSRKSKQPEEAVGVSDDPFASSLEGVVVEPPTPTNGDTSPRPFGGQTGPLSAADKAQRMANRRRLYLMRRTAEDTDDELIGVFDNKFQLRKFMAHAVILDKKLASKAYVIRGRELSMEATING